MSDTCTLGKQLWYAAQNAAEVKQRVALSSLSAKNNDTNNKKGQNGHPLYVSFV